MQSTPPPQLEPTETNDEARKTNDLVASFMEFMDLVKDEPKKDERQTDWIRDRFRAPDLQIPSQAKIAENIVHFLFERRLFEQAIAVYRQMHEDGLLPSPSTDALFLAVTMKASTAPGEDQLAGFKTILGYKSFTETHFMELLDHIVTLEMPPDTAAQLTRLFISVKDEGYRPSQALIMKLIDLQTRAGHIVEAADTIAEYDFNAGARSAFDSLAEPYARMIHATPASDQAAVDWIMGVMREKDVPIHVIVFNSLIARQSQSKDLRKAFAFYGVLMRLAATTPLRPDAVTYKHLFRLLGYQYQPEYKPNASRADADIGTVTPPRQLFNDMIALWFSEKFHPPAAADRTHRQQQIEMDQGLLTIAFRAFLYLSDYPAALIALRTMEELGLQITERTYFVLLRYMTRKVYYDIYSARMRRAPPLFAFELMGPFAEHEVQRDADTAYHWIMARLLDHNEEKGTYRGRVPTVEEILEQESTGVSGDTLDHWPLVNILRRAMRIREAERVKVLTPAGEQWAKRTLARTRYEMVPNDIPMWTWPKVKRKKQKN
ncbi:hypothetical protein FB451DRAFT_541552 [Mycena latifolia]|nr:hypothetical protein FB451DRAFT_541552 [Mycena latifolia]